MNKALAYALAAVLVGIATMLAPLMLVAPGEIPLSTYGDGKEALKYCPDVEASDVEITFDRRAFLARATNPYVLRSAGLIVIPSFLTALGGFLYLKRRMRR